MQLCPKVKPQKVQLLQVYFKNKLNILHKKNLDSNSESVFKIHGYKLFGIMNEEQNGYATTENLKQLLKKL